MIKSFKKIGNIVPDHKRRKDQRKKRIAEVWGGFARCCKRV